MRKRLKYVKPIPAPGLADKRSVATAIVSGGGGVVNKSGKSGGVSASFDLIEPHIRASLRKHVFGSPAGDVPLLVSELGERAGVIGAAHLTTL